jgi:hypothetical protein
VQRYIEVRRRLPRYISSSSNIMSYPQDHAQSVGLLKPLDSPLLVETVVSWPQTHFLSVTGGFLCYFEDKRRHGNGHKAKDENW